MRKVDSNPTLGTMVNKPRLVKLMIKTNDL